MKEMKDKLQDLYCMDFDDYEAFLNEIDKSLEPRSPELMFQKFKELQPKEDDVILDVGCRDARHICMLAKDYDSNFIGVDIVEMHFDLANKAIEENNLDKRVKTILADATDLPLEDNCVDYIWIYDVLGHMPDINALFKSLYRVLKPGGKIMIFHVTATDQLTKEEAKYVLEPLLTFPNSIYQSSFEKAFEDAGFECVEKDVVSSEIREYKEEAGNNTSSKQLVRIAKLLRKRDYYIEKFGENIYEEELANCYYGVYQMIGKLCPVIYTLQK